jgi:hypothetical protein
MPPEPWQTPQGRACIDRWIAASMTKVNAYQGGAEFNARKPYSINQYGLLEGRRPFGPFSVHAPDDFPQYHNDKYEYMWAQWIPRGEDGHWAWSEWNGAGVEALHSFVEKCLAGKG